MQVVITKGQLEAVKACNVYLDSPEWDALEESLVYANWEATVERLLATRAGSSYLAFLVSRELVPMTMTEFKAARTARERTTTHGI